MKVSKKLKEILEKVSSGELFIVEESTRFDELMNSLKVDYREEIDLHFKVKLLSFPFLGRDIKFILPLDEIYEEICKSRENNKIVKKIILEFSKGDKVYGIPIEWRTKE